MGAIFRDKKKLVKYNKYSILYQWDKYNAECTGYSTTAYYIVSAGGGTSVSNGSPGWYFSHTDPRNNVKYSSVNNCYIFDTSSMTYVSTLNITETLNINYEYMVLSSFFNTDAYYSPNGYYVKPDNIRYCRSDNCKHSVIGNNYRQGSTYYGIETSTSKSKYPANGKSGTNYWYVYIGETKGDYIESIQANKGAYPDGGVQDGYYYKLA